MNLLPTDTLDGIVQKNYWCGNGRKIAKAFYRVAKSPIRIDAAHILSALVYLEKRYGAHVARQYPNHNYATRAICRLLDVNTANRIMRIMKRKALPHRLTGCLGRWDTRKSEFVYQWKRHYPTRIVRGQQLYHLLDTYTHQDQLKVLCEALRFNFEKGLMEPGHRFGLRKFILG